MGFRYAEVGVDQPEAGDKAIGVVHAQSLAVAAGHMEVDEEVHGEACEGPLVTDKIGIRGRETHGVREVAVGTATASVVMVPAVELSVRARRNETASKTRWAVSGSNELFRPF